MADELPVRAGFHVDEAPSENAASDTQEGTKNAVGDDRGNHRQTIFDERFSALMNGFGAACQEHKVEIATAIAIHPDEEHPLVFMRGSLYENARALTRLLRILKRQIDDELNS